MDARRLRKGPTPLIPLALIMATLVVAGCGRAPEPRHDPATPTPPPLLWPAESGEALARPGCDILTGGAEPGASLVIALTDSVSPRLAPIPHNPSERLVFSHLYETLVRVDCQGRLQPGLATSWTCTQDSTLWVFSLRPGARFWDGSLVTARDVAAAWSANQGCPRAGDATPLWTWFNTRAKTISLLEGNRLSIRLPEPQARFPRLLAHPATAVAVRREGWVWPVGSGPLRLRPGTPGPLPDLPCRPNIHHPEAPIWQDLVFRVRPGADPRDLAAGEADIFWTRDLEAVAFYRDLPGFQVHPLPWDRVYLLACPPALNPTGGDLWSPLVDALDPSRDVSAVQARGWSDIVLPTGQETDCPQLTGPVPGAGSAQRDWQLGMVSLDARTIAFARDDAAARQLARRLAALGPADVRAVPVHPGALDFLLHWQMSGAVILGMDQEFSTGCLQTADLLGKAAWLQAAALGIGSRELQQNRDSLVQARTLSHKGSVDPAESLLRDHLIHPLALTRAWLITRGSWRGLTLHFDGTPRLGGLGRPREAEIAP